MLFNDPPFLLVFLPLTLCAYVVARRLVGARAVLGVLVIASIVFYGWWNPFYLPLLCGLAAFNFAIARWITAERQRQPMTQAHVLPAAGVGLDLLALPYFHYADFLISTANALLDDRVPAPHRR